MSHVSLDGVPPPTGFAMIGIVEEEGVAAMRTMVNETHAILMTEMSPNRKTGKSMRSVFRFVSVVGGTVIGVIGSEYDPVRWLDEGTGVDGPYGQYIEPKEHTWMKFPEPGNSSFRLTGEVRSGRRGKNAAYFYARRVRGIKPRHYFDKARAVFEPRTHLIMDLHADRAMARIAASRGR